jgi:thiol-disulfide isomerase/thioredoxin
MRRFWIAAALGVLTVTAVSAAPWLEDFEAAKKAAAATGKLILVDVTGSDWCPPCQQMEAEVFSRPGFAAVADRYVLLRLDYPRTVPQTERLKTQNQRLAEQYPFDGLPTYFMIDSQGTAYAKHSGYVPGGVTAFTALTQSFEKQKPVLDGLAAAVSNAAAGAAKAQAEDALYRQAEAWNLEWRYADLPLKIVQEDKDGKANLKPRYQVYNAYQRLLVTWASSDFKQAVAQLAKLSAQSEPWTDLKQKILFTQGMILLNALGDEVKARDTFREVRALAADSDIGQRAAELLDQLP